ncbi:hypothetical protein COHA_010801, partial [Chlorella ohadii]
MWPTLALPSLGGTPLETDCIESGLGGRRSKAG